MAEDLGKKVEDVWKVIVKESQRINGLLYNPLKPLSEAVQKGIEDYEALKKEIAGYSKKPNSSYKVISLLGMILGIGIIFLSGTGITGRAIGAFFENQFWNFAGLILFIVSLFFFKKF